MHIVAAYSRPEHYEGQMNHLVVFLPAPSVCPQATPHSDPSGLPHLNATCVPEKILEQFARILLPNNFAQRADDLTGILDQSAAF